MIALCWVSVLLAEPPVRLGEAAVHQIVQAQSFELEQSYRYDWSAEHPSVQRGLLLELEVDPAWLRPSDMHQAVLYADGVPVERIGTGWPSGHLWVVVPGATDTSSLTLYFRGEDLPEAISAAEGQQALSEARRAGAQPLPVPPHGPPRRLRDQAALYALAAGAR